MENAIGILGQVTIYRHASVRCLPVYIGFAVRYQARLPPSVREPPSLKLLECRRTVFFRAPAFPLEGWRVRRVQSGFVTSNGRSLFLSFFSQLRTRNWRVDTRKYHAPEIYVLYHFGDTEGLLPCQHSRNPYGRHLLSKGHVPLRYCLPRIAPGKPQTNSTRLSAYLPSYIPLTRHTSCCISSPNGNI